MAVEITRGGIAYNFQRSPYKYVVKYDTGEIWTFVFSSALNVTKFQSRLEENRERIRKSLSGRFGFDVVLDNLADVKLYDQVEKRGFLIYSDKEEFTWLSNIKLSGAKMTSGN